MTRLPCVVFVCPFSFTTSRSTLPGVMVTADTNSTERDNYDADEWGQYRSLSTTAVISLLLGFCSAVMFASPLLVVVPLAAAATALLALRSIAASEGSLSGAKLARWGLALAIMFCVAAFARVKVRDMLLQRQADRVARQWLTLAAEGRTQEMLELMTKEARDKLMPAAEPGQPTPFFGQILASALARQDPLVSGLQQAGAAAVASSQIQQAAISASSTPPVAAMNYQVGDSKAEQQQCFLALKRFKAADQQVVWLIDSWSIE